MWDQINPVQLLSNFNSIEKTIIYWKIFCFLFPSEREWTSTWLVLDQILLLSKWMSHIDNLSLTEWIDSLLRLLWVQKGIHLSTFLLILWLKLRRSFELILSLMGLNLSLWIEKRARLCLLRLHKDIWSRCWHSKRISRRWCCKETGGHLLLNWVYHHHIPTCVLLGNLILSHHGVSHRVFRHFWHLRSEWWRRCACLEQSWGIICLLSEWTRDSFWSSLRKLWLGSRWLICL